LETGAPASVEASVGYYPGCIDLLTRRPSRAGRQCQVGSLTVPEPDERSRVRLLVRQGWYFTGGLGRTGVPPSKPPTYPTHFEPGVNTML